MYLFPKKLHPLYPEISKYRIERKDAEKSDSGGKGERILTLPETNSLPLKMDGWNTTFLLGKLIFRGYVSFREGRFLKDFISMFKSLYTFQPPWKNHL